MTLPLPQQAQFNQDDSTKTVRGKIAPAVTRLANKLKDYAAVAAIFSIKDRFMSR